jgi:hypothetical protein
MRTGGALLLGLLGATVAVVACSSSTTLLSPGCVGSPGMSCSPNGADCPGPPSVCVQCGAGLYVMTASNCLCTAGTWACGPPTAGEVACPYPNSAYIDPSCSVMFRADAGGGSTGADACVAGMSECCGFGTSYHGVSCEQDYGPAICGLSGSTCPNGGNPAPACSEICTEYPDAAPEASPDSGPDAESDATGSGDGAPDASPPSDAGDGG